MYSSVRYYAHSFRCEAGALAVPGGGYNVFKQPVYVGDVAQGIVNAALKDLGQDGQIYQAVGSVTIEGKI